MAEEWSGDWAAHSRHQRATIAALTPMQRLEWVEETVRLLADAGLLDRDRTARQLAADTWWQSMERRDS